MIDNIYSSCSFRVLSNKLKPTGIVGKHWGNASVKEWTPSVAFPLNCTIQPSFHTDILRYLRY